jgi:hypothetical protein
MSVNGAVSKILKAIALLMFLMSPQKLVCQEGILDSVFTFRAGSIKTGNALGIITRQTGYHFTYDSRLVDPEIRVEMNFRQIPLRSVLDSILKGDSLVYSVIDEFIIISREIPRPPVVRTDTLAVPLLQDITGVIVDGESSEPLPFAALGLKNTGRGTVSNSGGEFGLRIHPRDYDDTLVVSYLGYFAREIPVRQSLGNFFRIEMRREFISIPEIIIKNQIPWDVVNKVRFNLTRNYGNTPARLSAFYREGVMRKNELQTYSEAVLQIYKSAYSGTLLGDQVKVLKSRKIENLDISDTIAVRLKAGLNTCLQLDGIKHGFDFISGESMLDYSYRLTDIVSFDDEAAFEIEFTPREEADVPMFHGSLFINTTDYALLRAEFRITPEYLKEMRSSFITNPSKDFSTWPVSVDYSVAYRKVADRYYLNHVRGDLRFESKQKKRLFKTQFDVFFEMAVTSSSLENVERFEKEDLAPVHSVFSRTIRSYDPVFWGNQEFLKPEESLLNALMNMKVKLQEFSE